mgnify:CR=1 FL=1
MKRIPRATGLAILLVWAAAAPAFAAEAQSPAAVAGSAPSSRCPGSTIR